MMELPQTGRFEHQRPGNHGPFSPNFEGPGPDLRSEAIVARSGSLQRPTDLAREVSYLNPTPDRENYFRHALAGQLEKLMPEEAALRDKLRDPTIRRLLEQQKSVVIMPVTARELDDATVLVNIAREHRRLIGDSDGNLKIKIIFNDHASSSPDEVAANLEKFKRFMNDNYFAHTVPSVYGTRQILVGESVSFHVMNDSHVQEKLVEVHRKTGGENRAAPGKGNAIAIATFFAIREGAENIVLHDSDILTFDKTPIIQSLLIPLLNEGYSMTKLSFTRYANGVMNGRLTRGFSLPILQALHEYHRDTNLGADGEELRNAQILKNLSMFRYPFSGEIAFKAGYLRDCRIHPNYGLESGFINDAAAKLAVGIDGKIGDVQVSQYDHFHSPMGNRGEVSSGLHRMLEQTFDGMLVPLISQRIVPREAFGTVDDPDSIIGRAHRIWEEGLVHDLKTVWKLVEDTRKSSGTQHTVDNVFARVRDELEVVHFACVERFDGGHFEERVSLNERDKVAKLEALVTNEGLPREMVYGARLIFQFQRELASNSFFAHLEDLIKKSAHLDNMPNRPQFGTEFASWDFDPAMFDRGVKPLFGKQRG